MSDGLERFVDAQRDTYRTALEEIQAGRKRSHWMWFVFPQIEGLGRSGTARYYAVKNLKEAKEYMEHPVLGKRLVEISEALLHVKSDCASEVMGWPDDLKLRSSMTLFAVAKPECTVFQKVLDRFFQGEKDPGTLEILGDEEQG